MCGPYGVTRFGFWSENFPVVVFVSGFQPAEGDSTQQMSRDGNQTINLTDQSYSVIFISFCSENPALGKSQFSVRV